MSTTIPCNVDTTPMAKEINSVSRHVDGTTTAVVTMQAAVISAENRSAEKVCSNVNRGFLTMLRSQISQKIASKHSRVEALLLKLSQQKRMLLNIKNNMEREYGRIAARYNKTFTSINKELDVRIHQIDQPIFEFVNRDMASSSNRMNAHCSWIYTSQAEVLTKEQQIVASNMKHNAFVALEQSANFLTHIGEQRVLTDKILLSNPRGNDERPYLAPIVVCETINNPQGFKNTDIRMPEGISSETQNTIASSIHSEELLSWKKEDKNPQIEKEFESILSNSSLSSRTKSLIAEMFSSSNFDSL